MDHTISNKREKKSYTLSPESVGFLNALCKKQRAPSASAVLEEILQAARREQERLQVERTVADYYNSLSPTEMKEQKHWGDFALEEFPKKAS